MANILPIADDEDGLSVRNKLNEAITEANDVDNKVTGPASATDTRIAVFDGVTGKLIKEVPVTISDLGIVTMSNNLQMGNNNVQNVQDIDAVYGEFGSAFIDGNLNVTDVITVNGGINLNGSDLTSVDQITQSHSASGTGVSLTHSGTGNALVITKTNSGDAVDVVSGSVRIQALTADRYLFIDSNNRVTVKTTAEVLSEIGALPLAGGTMTGAILGDQAIRGYRPVADPVTSDFTLSSSTANQFQYIQANGGAIDILLNTTTTNLAAIGTEWDFLVINTNNAVSIEVDTGVTAYAQGIGRVTGADIITVTGFVAFQIKKTASNEYAIIGGGLSL